MSDSQDPLAAITSFLEEQKPGDVALSIAPPPDSSQPAKLLLHSSILSMASSVLAGALESQHGCTLEVGEHAWTNTHGPAAA
jgi:hypothetical protein